MKGIKIILAVAICSACFSANAIKFQCSVYNARGTMFVGVGSSRLLALENAKQLCAPNSNFITNCLLNQCIEGQ